MIIYVDIDNTIFDTDGMDYSGAKPIPERIKKINDLYDEGNEITYYTARGSLLKDRLDEFIQLTRNQLKEWNCKYHFLSIGEKPAYDLLICDKTKRIEEL